MPASDESVILPINLSTSFISLFGSLFMVTIYIVFKENRNFAFKLVFCLSISDIFLSIGNILTLGEYHKPENSEAMCVLQGFVRNYFGLCSVFWTMVIAWTLYSTVIRNITNGVVYERRFYLFAYGVPLIITIMYE